MKIGNFFRWTELNTGKNVTDWFGVCGMNAISLASSTALGGRP